MKLQTGNNTVFRGEWGTLRATLVVAFLCCCSTVLPPGFAAASGQGSKMKGGYYTAGSSHLLPSSGLNATLFTHLFYAFATVSRQDNSTVVIAADDVEEIKTFSTDMKRSNPGVSTLISISVSGAQFANVLRSNASRKTFINSSIALAREFQFDGLDLDWEFSRSQNEMDEFGHFLGEWRRAVIEDAASHASPLLLTAAVYFASTMLFTGKGAYPVASIVENLDFVNIMCYDFHGTWDVSHTGANANLYDNQSLISADHGITSWLDAGLPPEKASLGLTLYGRSWVLKDQKAAAGLNAPATAAGPAQPVSHAAGIFYYFEVANWIEEKNATVVHDDTQVTGYCYADNVWVSYEDPTIISTKVLYAKTRNLRGYFFWEVSYDSNWEVSTAASQTLDDAATPAAAAPDQPPELAPAPAPAASSGGAVSSTSVSLFFAVAGLVLSVLLLRIAPMIPRFFSLHTVRNHPS